MQDRNHIDLLVGQDEVHAIWKPMQERPTDSSPHHWERVRPALNSFNAVPSGIEQLLAKPGPLDFIPLIRFAYVRFRGGPNKNLALHAVREDTRARTLAHLS